MRGWGALARNLNHAVIAVTVAAARGIDQPRYQKRFTMLTRQVSVHKRGRCVMTTTAILDLVDRRHGRREIRNLVNLVWIAMAVIAGCSILVNASADGS